MRDHKTERECKRTVLIWGTNLPESVRLWDEPCKKKEKKKESFLILCSVFLFKNSALLSEHHRITYNRPLYSRNCLINENRLTVFLKFKKRIRYGIRSFFCNPLCLYDRREKFLQLKLNVGARAWNGTWVWSALAAQSQLKIETIFTTGYRSSENISLKINSFFKFDTEWSRSFQEVILQSGLVVFMSLLMKDWTSFQRWCFSLSFCKTVTSSTSTPPLHYKRHILR